MTNPKINKLTTKNFAVRLAVANLVTKSDFDNKLITLNRKINSNQKKHLLFENEFKNTTDIWFKLLSR